MPTADADSWPARTRAVLSRYADPLVRTVAGHLVRARAPLDVDDLIEKCVAALNNPPAVDRRLKELTPAGRALLALVGLSRRAEWKVGHLIAALAALGHSDGFGPVLELLDQGLLYPNLRAEGPPLTDFAEWIGRVGGLTATVFAPPAVALRARNDDLNLPDLSSANHTDLRPPPPPDGLDWPLRLAVVWQLAADAPIKLTQANTLFKRDLTRLQGHDLLAVSVDANTPLADAAALAVFWAESAGLLANRDGELTAAPFPPGWGDKLAPCLADLWAGLTAVEGWDPVRGYAPPDGPSAFPSVSLLSLLLLAKPAAGAWVDPGQVADWLWEHHPSWAGTLPKEGARLRAAEWVEGFLLGVAVPLNLVETAPLGDGWLARLTDTGRHILVGSAEPPAAPPFPQTLLVQPNAEVLAYRQGLNPGLIAKLTRFAGWKAVGPACTLVLTAEDTYRGLESGLSLAGMTQTLNQHGMRPVPPAVADLLQRWSNKRERVSVYASATLVEFQSPADLDAAIARGVVSVRVTDRIGLTDDGREPDFKHLRLIGNRDYEAKPLQCIAVEPDGVTLTVDAAQADLLLEAEIGRLADPVPDDPPAVRRFRLTPATLTRATAAGWSLAELDSWFVARTGAPLPPAGRLFVVGPTAAPPTATRLLVVELPSAELVDGLVQWPATAALVDRRLGPTAVAVSEEAYPQLREVLAGLGIAGLG